MLPSELPGAEAAGAPSEPEPRPEACTAEAAGEASELGSTEATEGASELAPARRHRVSRRVIVRARNARLAERRALREGGAPRACARGPGGFGVALAPVAAGTPSAPLAHSQTAGASNTVCISDAPGQRSTGMDAARDLARFGEIARIDFSLASTLGTMLVTFFDVRDAQMVLLHLGSRAAPFPHAAQEGRVVLVDVPGFCAKTGRIEGFQYFGEVANVDILAGQSVVEFYDLRSAQALLAAAGDCATLVPNSAFAPPATPARRMPESLLTQLPAPPGLERPVAAPTGAGAKGNGSTADSASQQASDATKHRAAQTKVAHTNFHKLDIIPEAILRGQDKRTTVMVRHLHQTGPCSSKDILLFLERSCLGKRYSFFYMPYKEHGSVPAGFAFVNLASPLDVCTLHAAAASGPAVGYAVSYARLQGHESLVQHFSVSAVLQEQDPEKRPIFRPEVLIRQPRVGGPMKAKKALRILGSSGQADDVELRGPKSL